MTHSKAVQIAIELHNARCNAFWSFWLNGGIEPKDEDFAFKHGWYEIEGHRIGAHDYAPGPTYSE